MLAVTVESFTAGILSFVEAYGYLALFVFIVLETAWIIHFAPSELIIPAAAAHLVSTPGEFATFVAVGTVGAVVGSLLAYYLFGVNGDRILERYGHVLRVPESEIERSKAWFRRWGEGLMFWGRVVPVLRTPISVPAGFARMDLRRFTAYSFGGWLVYTTVLVWLVYTGADGRAPIDLLVDPASAAFAWYAPAVRTRPLLGVVSLVLLAGIGALLWHHWTSWTGPRES